MNDTKAPANGTSAPGTLTMQEAIDLERQAFIQDRERHERIVERKRRLGMPITGEVLTREEREARIWTFMLVNLVYQTDRDQLRNYTRRNHKPTDSDMEDDESDEDEDEDPASWFEDDQDDGRKGQDIVDPDMEDLSDIIRVDASRIHYSTFYEPRDDGD